MGVCREGDVMMGLDELRERGRMTWIDEERGWMAAPEDILTALSSDGFDECKREMTASRRDRQPAGGVWEGINTRTGSVASAIWVNRPIRPHAIVFIAVDGESLKGGHGPSTDPNREDGDQA
jgi:hypothetical protein